MSSSVSRGGVQDEGEWSDDELTSADEVATQALDGSFKYGDPLEGEALADFDSEYARKVEQEIVEHGGGDAPQLGVVVTSVGPTVSDQGEYRITADGADTVFCMDVKRTHDGYIETLAPGLPATRRWRSCRSTRSPCRAEQAIAETSRSLPTY